MTVSANLRNSPQNFHKHSAKLPQTLRKTSTSPGSQNSLDKPRASLDLAGAEEAADQGVGARPALDEAAERLLAVGWLTRPVLRCYVMLQYVMVCYVDQVMFCYVLLC